MACCCGLCVPNMTITKANTKENQGEFFRLSITEAKAKQNLQIFICNHFCADGIETLLDVFLIPLHVSGRFYDRSSPSGEIQKNCLTFFSTTFFPLMFRPCWRDHALNCQHSSNSQIFENISCRFSAHGGDQEFCSLKGVVENIHDLTL